jgi:type IV pilus assembly protein PilC
MPQFEYTARRKSGEHAEGRVEANDRASAVTRLEAQGLVPVSLRETLGKRAAEPGARKKFLDLRLKRGARPHMGRREMLLFSRELSDLLASGMKLGNALHTLSQRDPSQPHNQVVAALRDEIVQGGNLSDSLAQRPSIFPDLYVSMVRAGEASGQMSQALEQLCAHYERVQQAREKISSAMIYPAIVLIMGLLTIVVTMIFVIPKFEGIFSSLGRTLPLPTRILIASSDAFIKYGWFMLAALVIAVILVRRALKTEAGLRFWHRLKLRIPVVRNIVCANAYAHFARTLQALLSNGVSVLQALEIVENTVGNVIIAAEIRNARGKVTDGASLSGPLRQGGVFPNLLTDMLAVGEESGDVPSALGHITRRYDNELARSVTVFTTVLEPLLILLIAGIVGFVAISMLLAVFDMTSGLNV